MYLLISFESKEKIGGKIIVWIHEFLKTEYKRLKLIPMRVKLQYINNLFNKQRKIRAQLKYCPDPNVRVKISNKAHSIGKKIANVMEKNTEKEQ